jgi:hypothetical protein
MAGVLFSRLGGTPGTIRVVRTGPAISASIFLVSMIACSAHALADPPSTAPSFKLSDRNFRYATETWDSRTDHRQR